MGVKVLNENICGFSMKVVEKLGSKAFLKAIFGGFFPIYSVSKVLLTDATYYSGNFSCCLKVC